MAVMWKSWLVLLNALLALFAAAQEQIPIKENVHVQSDAVQEATSILQSMAPSSRHATASRQTGLTYYAKELFTQLFLTGPPTSSSTSSSPSPSDPLDHALGLLTTAADSNDPDALFLLANINFYGNYSLPRNFSTAFSRYEQLASLDGNATAQYMLGFMYATGIGGAVEPNQAKALLYYTFAAEGGSANADMAVAYRYHAGIGSPKNCDESVHYYKKVADKAMGYLRSGPPGNHMVVKDSYRLADEVGGVYGEGASVSSSGANARQASVNSDAHASFEDVVEYLDLMSRKGDLKATFSLAKLHYDGSRGMNRDLRLAQRYFLEVARVVWSKGRTARQEVSSSTEKLASKAAGFLGRMFLRGEGMAQDFKLAERWFKRGVSNGDALSQYSLGIMYLNGLIPDKPEPDPYRAAEYFLPAADQDLASAQVRLGVLFLDQGDTNTALQYFDHAARNGHIEAYYYLAELSYQGIGRDQSCHVAAAYYKIVCEKAEILLASFKEANDAFEIGDLDTALLDYLMAAEQGFEAAQANVAYILDKFALPRYKGLLTIGAAGAATRQIAQIAPDAPKLALIHWTRSAKQQNIDSLLKMGDYHLLSLGVPPSTHSHKKHTTPQEKAAQCYQAAAETHHSAQAYWNLGWMYENGVGMGQDFHLAKRFYDLALETNKEAYLPVKLALGKLRARSAWNRILGGKGGVRSIEEEKAPRKTWTEWLHAFLEADAALYREQHPHDHTPNPDEAAGAGEDWYDHADQTPGGDYDELEFDEEGLIESVLIIGAAALLMILVVYRRRRQEERERERLGLPAGAPLPGQVVPGQDGGLFPQRGEEGFADWAVGGVGH